MHVLERAGIHLFVIWVKMHCILKHNFKGTETITKLLSKMHGFLCHLRKTALCKQGSIVITMLSTHALSYNTSPHTHTPTPNAHKSQHALTHPHTHTKTTYHTCMHAHTHTHMHTQAFNAKSSQNYGTAKKFGLASRDWNIGAYIFNVMLDCALGIVVVVVLFHGSCSTDGSICSQL